LTNELKEIEKEKSKFKLTKESKIKR